MVDYRPLPKCKYPMECIHPFMLGVNAPNDVFVIAEMLSGEDLKSRDGRNEEILSSP